MTEEWKQIKIFDTATNYDISNLGNIRKHDTKRMLAPSKSKEVENAYEFYTIDINGKKYHTGIHRLVALMFIPIPKKYIEKGLDQNKLEVDHIDGIRYHNSVDNLWWLTASENNKEMIKRVGIVKSMKPETVLMICELLEKGLPVKMIAAAFNKSEDSVNSIRKRITYKNISKDFHFKSKQISPDMVRKICELLQEGKTAEETAKELNVSKSVVHHIRAGVSWKDISKDYYFKPKKQSDEDVIKACELIQNEVSLAEITKITGLKNHVLLDIRNGKTYTEISKNYDLKPKRYKIKDEVIHSICRDLEEGIKKTSAIAADNHVSTTFVKALRNRKNRNDITSQYKY